MGAKLTAGVLVGALAVVAGSSYVAVTILGSHTVGEGDAAAGRVAAAHADDVTAWLTPPDAGKYTGGQLVAAMLAARSDAAGAVTIAATASQPGTISVLPIAWSGSTAATGGARVTIRITAKVSAHSGGLFGSQSTSGGTGERCYVYAILQGDVTAVRTIRCPPQDEAMKLPKPAPLPAPKQTT